MPAQAGIQSRHRCSLLKHGLANSHVRTPSHKCYCCANRGTVPVSPERFGTVPRLPIIPIHTHQEFS